MVDLLSLLCWLLLWSLELQDVRQSGRNLLKSHASLQVLSSYFKSRFIHLDSYSKRIRQKCCQFFIKEKLKKTFYFLTCILPNYVPHEITKEFWKSSHFWNVTACFLLRCQNSLRWSTPEKNHFHECFYFYFHQNCPSNSYCSHYSM